jgi:hypothetical protein
MPKQTNRRSAKEIQELISQRNGVSAEYIHSTNVTLSDNAHPTVLTIISHSANTPSREDFNSLGKFALKMQSNLRAHPTAHAERIAREALFHRTFNWAPSGAKK